MGSENATCTRRGLGIGPRNSFSVPGDSRRHERSARLQGQAAGAAARMPKLIGVADSSPLGEQREQATLAEDRAGGLQGIGVGLTAPHRKGPEPHEQPAIPGLDQLGFRHEAHVSRGADAYEEGIPEALMVGGDDGLAAQRNVVRARDVHAKPQTTQRRHQPAHEGVEKSRHTLLAREEVTSSFVMRGNLQAFPVAPNGVPTSGSRTEELTE
jgi:hypothetical protein